MNVLTIRVQDYVTKTIDMLTKEKHKTRADIVRELILKAVKEEEINFYLEKFRKKEITLRTLAKKLKIPLWNAYELTSKVEFPYGREDIERDLKLIQEV